MRLVCWRETGLRNWFVNWFLKWTFLRTGFHILIKDTFSARNVAGSSKLSSQKAQIIEVKILKSIAKQNVIGNYSMTLSKNTRPLSQQSKRIWFASNGSNWWARLVFHIVYFELTENYSKHLHLYLRLNSKFPFAENHSSCSFHQEELWPKNCLKWNSKLMVSLKQVLKQ